MSSVTESTKAALGDHLNNTDDENIKRVLMTYSADAHYKVNLKNISTLDAKLLEPCAIYLGFIVRDGDDKKLYQNKKVLSDRIILKIESLFDSHCDDCDKPYRNKLTDKPPLNCQLCLQGSHSCENVQEKIDAHNQLKIDNLKPVGLVWLCNGCLEKNNLALLPSKIKGNKIKAPKESTSEEKEEENDEDPENEEKEGEDDDNDQERVSPRRNRDGDPIQRQDICEKYVKMECPHGLTGKRLIDGVRCPKNHPPRCHRYCRYGKSDKFGCKRGKDCYYLHPQLCKSSELRRVCLNTDCTFVHLKFTRRYENSYRPNNPPRFEEENGQRDRRQLNAENKPPQRLRFNSLSTIYTPYPPTVDVRRPAVAPPTQRRNSNTGEDNHFLERLMENLKDGIISQMEEKLTEFRTQIPTILLESNQWKDAMKQNQPPQHQPPIQQQIPQMPAQQPLQPHYLPPHQQTMHMPIPNYYQGLSF